MRPFAVDAKDDDNQPRMRTHRKHALMAVSLLFLTASAGGSDKPRTAPPVKPAAEYPMNDPHPNEKVTIAADPCTDKKDCPFFRLPYVSHGFVAVRVIVTNDRDDALNLDEVRIQLYPAQGEKEPAATVEDLNRRLFSTRQAEGTKIPLIPITIHHEPVDQKILNDDTDFGFQSTTIPAHSTRAGYVFYDTKSLDDPPLERAELYIKQVRYMDARGQFHELFAFSLPFDKWIAAQPKVAPAGK
jgi:hypothetical protein